MEPFLGDEGRNDSAGDDNPYQDGILALVDQAGIQTEKAGDRPKRQARAHKQGRIHSSFGDKAFGQEKNAQEFGRDFQQEKNEKNPECRGNEEKRDLDPTDDEKNGRDDRVGHSSQPVADDLGFRRVLEMAGHQEA